MPMNAYLQNKINGLSPEDLLILVFDELIISLKRCTLNIDFQKSISKAVNIITTLSQTLDRDSGLNWIDQMTDLYTFFIFEICSRDVERIEKIIPVVENIRDTWKEAIKLNK